MERNADSGKFEAAVERTMGRSDHQDNRDRRLGKKFKAKGERSKGGKRNAARR